MLTAIGLTSGGSSTVHIYTQTIHRTTQVIWVRVRAVPHLYELYPGIFLTIEEKAWKNLIYREKPHYCSYYFLIV
jgi:uncharacterized integral membrane protein